MSNAIEFTNVSKKYRKGEKFNSLRDSIPFLFSKAAREKLKKAKEDQEFWAVKNVSFNIKKGDVVGILGPNGAGKSTILKLLSRIIVPTKGSMKIHGRLAALIEVTAGFHPELTGRENVYLNGTILGMSRKEIDSRFNEIVEFSGISEFIDTPVKRYSSGMYSRLGFSVAAHLSPDILLVDEVLSVGDMAFQAQCSRKMRELLKSGTTIILVSHQLALIKSLCKRAILLQNGEVIREGGMEDVIPYYQNIVLEKTEIDFKKSLASSTGKVKVEHKSVVTIYEVKLEDGNGQPKESFKAGEPISLTLRYEARERVEKPKFLLEIIRSDGVSCCNSSNEDQGKAIDHIMGKGAIKIDLAKVNLAAGIYMAQLSVWDENMLHPFAIREEDVIRIVNSGTAQYRDAVFLPEMRWDILN